MKSGGPAEFGAVARLPAASCNITIPSDRVPRSSQEYNNMATGRTAQPNCLRHASAQLRGKDQELMLHAIRESLGMTGRRTGTRVVLVAGDLRSQNTAPCDPNTAETADLPKHSLDPLSRRGRT